MAQKTYCTRCGHERAWHPPASAGGGCEEARKDGRGCKCPKFADPYQPIFPPQDYRPRDKERTR